MQLHYVISGDVCGGGEGDLETESLLAGDGEDAITSNLSGIPIKILSLCCTLKTMIGTSNFSRLG